MTIGGRHATGRPRSVALALLLAPAALMLLPCPGDEQVAPDDEATAPASPPADLPAVLPPLVPAAKGAAAPEPLRPGESPQPTRSVAGRVVRARDGAALPGARLSVLGDAGWLTATSLEDGSFRMEGIPLPATMLHVEAQAGKDLASRQVNLPGGEEPLDLQVVLDTGSVLRGVVLDLSGAPVAGASVQLWPWPGQGVTDGGGRFELADMQVPLESLVELRAGAPWHASASASVFVPSTREEVPFVELRLPSCGRIEVRPLAPDGSPLLDPLLAVGAERQDGRSLLVVPSAGRTEAEPGVRVLDHLPAGRYVVRARRGYRDWMTVQLGMPASFSTILPDVVVREGETTRVDLVVRPGATLAGRVLDAAGAPAGGSMLVVDLLPAASGERQADPAFRFTEPGAITDAQGRYRLEGLPAGELRVRVSDPQGRLVGATRAYALRGDEERLAEDYELSEGHTLRGQVLEAGEQPVEGASVSVDGLVRRPHTHQGDAVSTDEGGWFEIGGLPAGPVNLTIVATGRGVLHAAADPAAPPARFVLQPPARLRGLVLDAGSGQSVERFGMRLEFEGYTQWLETGPRPDGRFDIEVLPATCGVTVAAPGYRLATVSDVTPTAGEPLCFRLERQR